MTETVKCSQGHENRSGNNFCAMCGERLSGGKATCPHCGTTIDSGSNFCEKCGKSTKEAKPTDLKLEMRWQRGLDDFATRIDVEDLHGTFKKGVIVEQGTKALLFINGALAETLQPGMYDLGGISSKIKNFDLYRTGSAILVDSGDVDLAMNMTGIFTKDPLNIDVTCKVIVQIENPTFFFNNVMKGRRSYLISELRGSLHTELHNALNEAIGQKSANELNWDLSLKRQFEVSIENHLRTTFQRNGLNFIQLRTVDYCFKRFNTVKGILEETFLLVSEDEAELQKRKRLFDVYDQTQLQAIIEETKEVEYRAKRQKVWADMRALVNSDKMNEIKSVDDLEAYIHEINKGKHLREDEVQELLNTFKQSGLRREFLIEKIGMEHDLEREKHRIELNRLGKVGEAEDELAVFEVKAKQERRDFEERLARARIGKDVKDVEREVWLDDEKAKASAKDLEREGDQKDIGMGLSTLERMKKMKTQEKRDEMDIETERLERLSKLGIEALITASGPDQAKILADLKKTETLKGMTEDQILAMGAAHSDELAKAFQEKFKGLSAQKQEELYREMMKQKDTSMATMQEMFNKALETQRDATVGVAQGGKVVYPPHGYSGLGPSGPGGTGFYNVNMETGTREVEFIICKKCKVKIRLKPDLKFCPECGDKIFDD